MLSTRGIWTYFCLTMCVGKEWDITNIHVFRKIKGYLIAYIVI